MDYFKNFKALTSLLLAFVLLAAPLLAQQRRNTTPKKPPAAEVVEPAPTFDSLLAADSYKVYSEVRNVGGLIHSPAINDLLDPLMKLGRPPKELKTIVKWLNGKADALVGSRMFAASWPSKPNLPQVLIGVEFSSPEEAKKFHPALRDFLPTLLPTPDPADSPASAPKASGGIGFRSGDGTLIATEAPSVQTVAPRNVAPGTEIQNPPAPPPFHLKQTGTLVLISSSPFEVRDLKPRGSLALEEDQNFTTARNRFASESIFVYIDLKSIENEEKLQRQKWEKEEQKRIAAQAANPPKVEETVDAVLEHQPPPLQELPPPPAPEPSIIDVDPPPAIVEERSSSTATLGSGPPDPVGRGFFPLFGMMFGGGMTKWPEALGAALVFEGDAYVIRTLVLNSAENKNNAIPFVPLFVPGPAIVPESPNVFPANTELFVSASLDYPQIYEELLKAIANADAVARRYSGRQPAREDRPPESPFAYYETKLGLKVKDDLLPLLGNEIALALPKRPKPPDDLPASAAKEAEPKPTRLADPIPVLAISVKDREGVKRLIPKIIEALGFKGANLIAQTEKRDGTELTSYAGQFAYAFIDNFLVLSPDAAETRRVVDAYINHETLASDSSFKNSTRWQPRQVLGQVYTAPGLVEQYFFGAARGSAQVSDKFAEFLNRVSPVIDPMTYSLTNDGLGPMHELHVPKNLVQLLVAGASSATNQSPLQTNEAMARMALYSIAGGQTGFKSAGGNYGTLDQLLAKSFLSKELVENHGYSFVVSVSGNKFEAIAVPIDYGTTGRMSFFIDETGVLRGGDHGGGAATVSDDPVDGAVRE